MAMNYNQNEWINEYRKKRRTQNLPHNWNFVFFYYFFFLGKETTNGPHQHTYQIDAWIKFSFKILIIVIITWRSCIVESNYSIKYELFTQQILIFQCEIVLGSILKVKKHMERSKQQERERKRIVQFKQNCIRISRNELVAK